MHSHTHNNSEKTCMVWEFLDEYAGALGVQVFATVHNIAENSKGNLTESERPFGKVLKGNGYLYKMLVKGDGILGVKEKDHCRVGS